MFERMDVVEPHNFVSVFGSAVFNFGWKSVVCFRVLFNVCFTLFRPSLRWRPEKMLWPWLSIVPTKHFGSRADV